MTFHNIEVNSIIEYFNTDSRTGLLENKARMRLEKYGYNSFNESKKEPIFKVITSQLKIYMVFILFLAALTSFIVGKNIADGIAIILIVLINALLYVFQERSTQKALFHLKKLTSPDANVLRSSRQFNMKASELVPGDIIFIKSGDFVPADCRIINCRDLMVLESNLTGDNAEVSKTDEIILAENVSPSDMKNMVFSGSVVTFGSATCIVCTTGMNTQIGKIANILSEKRHFKTPVQHQLFQVSTMMSILAVILCIIVFFITLFRWGFDNIGDVIMVAVTTALAILPEGLLAIITIIFANGIRRLIKKNIFIKRLAAIEFLGCASVICTDKAGTLTLNELSVATAYTNNTLFDITHKNKEKLNKLFYLSLLCNDYSEPEIGTDFGNSVDKAIYYAGLKINLDKFDLEQVCPRVFALPFTSDKMQMITIHSSDDKFLVIVKGAPAVVFPKCNSEEIEKAISAAKQMEEKALSIVVVAFKEIDNIQTADIDSSTYDDLTFAGILGLFDPPKQQAYDAIHICRQAGIVPIMLTGDKPATALATAKALNILQNDSQMITSTELSQMSDQELFAKISDYTVFSRLLPEHKARIVRAWQKLGNVVIMTGGGVNDAAALKAADIGCAMGYAPTDVAKNAADIYIPENNFSTIMDTVQEGRAIYSNIKKIVKYLISGNVGEMLAILVAVIVGFTRAPFNPVQLLWINVILLAFPAISFSLDKLSHDIMNRNPRRKREELFTNSLMIWVLAQGAFMCVLTVIAFIIGSNFNPFTSDMNIIGKAQTLAFVTFAFAQIMNSLNVRGRVSVFSKKYVYNSYLVFGLVISFVLQVLVTVLPIFGSIFGIVPLNATDWLIVSGLSLLSLAFGEGYKVIQNKFISSN